MEVQSMAHGTLSRFKPCSPSVSYRCCAYRVTCSSSFTSFWRSDSAHSDSKYLQISCLHARRRGGNGAHRPLSSHCALSSVSPRIKRSSILPSRASPNLVVRSEKDKKSKDSKGKKKGGQSKNETTKRAASAKSRGNVWSKDIAETEYQASRRGEEKAFSSKQQEPEPVAARNTRDGDARGKGWREGRVGGGNGNVPPGTPTDLELDSDNDYTDVFVSGGIPVKIQEVLQALEQMPNPVWPTFLSSNAGVWRGVGAAFSPITAEMEPVALGRKNEYLYDAAVLCTVETIPGPEGDKTNGSSLSRKVMWKVGNSFGEQSYEQVQDEPELFEDDVEADGDFSAVGINPIELESSAIAEGMVYPPEPIGEEFGTVEDTREFIQGPEARPEALYNPDKVVQDFGAVRENDPEWESMFKAGTVDAGLVEELRKVSSGMKVEVDTWQEGNAPVSDNESAPAYSDEWKDVMEEDTMTMEPGLVFFSDGSYSRGPVSLLPDDLATSERDYYKSPTFKIEQCLVTGKHRRLRLVHTISIMETGEEIQVLRVAVYEEQWMGPCNMESISQAGGVYLQPFSQQGRVSPNETTGSWKVFEMSATAFHQPSTMPMTRPSYAHFCQEVMQTQGLPEPIAEYTEAESDEDEDDEPIDDDPSVLWLPGGITASVEAKEEGQLIIGLGWFYDERTVLVMEREYGADGKLSEVRSQTKVKGGWAGGRM